MPRKLWAVFGSAIFLVIAPGFIAGLVPFWITRWQVQPEPIALRAAGVVLFALGAAVLLDSFARFALQGLGTPAPVAPPKHLVVTGWYRYVRNPMYVAVFAAILGQALFFGSVPLLEYAGLIWVAFHLFVLGYEEPALTAKFGAEYQQFREHVPRWIPRITPWRGSPRP